MTSEAAPTISADPPPPYQAEIRSADPELHQLMGLLLDPSSSFSGIVGEMKRVFQVNPSLIRDYFVPYSGMPMIFYISKRLSFLVTLLSSEEDVANLFRQIIDEFGADPNTLDSVMRQNVMFYSARAGSLLCCKTLRELGGSCIVADVHNQSALFYAAREGKTDVVEWLVQEGGCDINQLDRNGQTALFYASREDRLDCVVKMVGELGSDPLIRDIFKKRARGYLKGPNQRRTFDFLTEVERARDPSAAHLSQRKLFIVSNEPVGAAAMRLRQHKPYNPYHLEDEQVMEPAALPAQKRQKSSGTSTPANSSSAGRERIANRRSVSTNSAAQSPSSSEAGPPTPSPPPLLTGRSRFRVKAPLGLGGLETFEKSFPEFALWNQGAPSPANDSPSPPKAFMHRPPRTPAQSLTPSWVPVVSLLLRGPLWRYGPAAIFHKPLLQLPSNLGAKFQPASPQPELKLSIDLSVIRKKLEKGKYSFLTEIDKDVRGMFNQAYDLAGGQQNDLGLLTRATEIYYDQQMAGSGLAAVIRDEAEDLARSARLSILTNSTDGIVDSS